MEDWVVELAGIEHWNVFCLQTTRELWKREGLLSVLECCVEVQYKVDYTIRVHIRKVNSADIITPSHPIPHE